jgi:hypothetical protein
MQRTREYRPAVAVAGHDPVGALAWLSRQDRWDRRLRALEGAPAEDEADTTRTRPGSAMPVVAASLRG